ncbi:hypothetical protein B0J13DRAFT_633111 [Dactylonectria estremocensis]|uniref:Uncharacterized protein n=1 Tax=Dactylonectria estremocensis TaxID=1079267 RepID=A0A9P9FHF9_9HYPO|nr:hypothetical protein B0J13DRAFT_633111 [Dactylonectria estremocensis]
MKPADKAWTNQLNALVIASDHAIGPPLRSAPGKRGGNATSTTAGSSPHARSCPCEIASSCIPSADHPCLSLSSATIPSGTPSCITPCFPPRGEAGRETGHIVLTRRCPRITSHQWFKKPTSAYPRKRVPATLVCPILPYNCANPSLSTFTSPDVSQGLSVLPPVPCSPGYSLPQTGQGTRLMMRRTARLLSQFDCDAGPPPRHDLPRCSRPSVSCEIQRSTEKASPVEQTARHTSPDQKCCLTQQPLSSATPPRHWPVNEPPPRAESSEGPESPASQCQDASRGCGGWSGHTDPPPLSSSCFQKRPTQDRCPPNNLIDARVRSLSWSLVSSGWVTSILRGRQIKRTHLPTVHHRCVPRT